MSAQVKGWCPGALRPMASGDGLVVRLRLPLGRLTPSEARGIAAAALAHGNGQMDLSMRGNLQLRGVSDESHPALLADLAGLGLLDSDLERESRRNILISPFATPEDGAEDLALEIQSRLMELPDLPAKFGFVIDTGPLRVLADAPGDLRLERGQGGGLILRAEGAELGQAVTPQNAISALIALSEWFVEQGGVQGGRGRMRALTARGLCPPEADSHPVQRAARPAAGPVPQGILAALEFGSLSAETLFALAALGHPLRLTPWRMLLIAGMTDKAALAAIPGLITDPSHPVLALRACPGAPFCPQGLAPTRDLARALAPQVPAGMVLHVSGCAKGCAHPSAADLTLVARANGFAASPAAAAPDVSGQVISAQDLLHIPNLFAHFGAA